MSRKSRGYQPIKTLGVKGVNKRISAGLMSNGDVVFRFKRLSCEGIKNDSIRLTPEGIMAMFRLALDLGALNDIENKLKGAIK